MAAAILQTCVGTGRDLGRGLLHLLFPPCCHLCARPLSEAAAFCEPCKTALPCAESPVCPRCAATVGPFAIIDGGCAVCRKETLAFDAVLRLGLYEGGLREAVLRIKHHSGETLAELLGEFWAGRDGAALRGPGTDVVVPVPLHWRRRWRRGYNQSAALARGLAAGLRLPCLPAGLRRTRATPVQTAQTFAGRRDNVRGAFAPGGMRLDGKTVLLMDDVMTTGATASEAARALKAAGAGRVVVAALARAHARA